MSDSRGFTLLEAVVAFMIAAGAVGVLLQVYASSAAGGEKAAEIARAVGVATAQLERAGRQDALTPGRRDGATPDGYRWMVVVENFSEPVPEADPSSDDLFEVTVTVLRRDDSPLVELHTLRLQSRRGPGAQF